MSANELTDDLRGLNDIAPVADEVVRRHARLNGTEPRAEEYQAYAIGHAMELAREVQRLQRATIAIGNAGDHRPNQEQAEIERLRKAFKDISEATWKGEMSQLQRLFIHTLADAAIAQARPKGDDQIAKEEQAESETRACSERTRLHAIAAELKKTMQCNCDLDNWQPEPDTGHSRVCRIHKAAVLRERAR